VNENLLRDGKIARWPKKAADKGFVLEYIASKIPRGRVFAEREINEIITGNILFDDYALIRRELVEGGFLTRTMDCREYSRTEGT